MIILPNRRQAGLKSKFICGIILIGILSLTAGCNPIINSKNASYEKLDKEKLDSYTTDINDRAAYYEKNVENRLEHMTQDEKLSRYFVNLKVEYSGIDNYKEDDIIFLRNDNVYKGDLYNGDDEISLPPGIYRVISEKVEGGRDIFGEIDLLTPGENVVLKVDYNSFHAYISGDQKAE